MVTSAFYIEHLFCCVLYLAAQPLHVIYFLSLEYFEVKMFPFLENPLTVCKPKVDFNLP